MASIYEVLVVFQTAAVRVLQSCTAMLVLHALVRSFERAHTSNPVASTQAL
jgi:hypothetical protein